MRGFSPTSCNLSRRCNAARKRSSRAQSQIHSSSAHMICAAQQRKFNLGFRACTAQSQPQICQSLRHPISQIRSASSARSHTHNLRSQRNALLTCPERCAATQIQFGIQSLGSAVTTSDLPVSASHLHRSDLPALRAVTLTISDLPVFPSCAAA